MLKLIHCTFVKGIFTFAVFITGNEKSYESRFGNTGHLATHKHILRFHRCLFMTKSPLLPIQSDSSILETQIHCGSIIHTSCNDHIHIP